MFVRIFVAPNDRRDLAKVHVLQQNIKVYPENQGTFEPQTWDKKSQDTIREALSTLGTFMPNFDKAFGTKEEVDPVAYLIGAATGWGGNPVKDAKYDPLVIPNNDGDQAYTLTVKDVPVEGFWSVSVYDAEVSSFVLCSTIKLDGRDPIRSSSIAAWPSHAAIPVREFSE